VGFKTDAEAQKARDWFDRTYVGSTRIRVSIVDVCFAFVRIRSEMVDKVHHVGDERCPSTET
jgi:hypothetical protein